MRTNRLLTFALIIQLILVFFAPPIPFGERLIFLSDLWIIVWVMVFGVHYFTTSSRENRKIFSITVTALVLLFGIVFIHGKGRPSLALSLNKYLPVPTDDLFSFGREAVIALRFLSWCVAGILVAKIPVERKWIERTLATCCGIAVLSMIAASIYPAVRTELGIIYSYNPDAMPWADRIYGVFRSPIEACVVLSLSLLLLIQNRKFLPVCGFILIGILLSKTLTAFLTLILAGIISAALALPLRKLIIALTTASLIVLTITLSLWNTVFFAPKQDNFIFRLKVWAIYWDAAISRLDYLILGNGFHPNFTDNIYVFLFSRGGLLLLGSASIAFSIWYYRRSKTLTPLQRMIPLFFLISGLTVDNVILRPVASVLICLGVVVLSERKEIKS